MPPSYAGIGIEIKWVKQKTRNFDRDVEKLKLHHQQKGAPGYLILFGPEEFVFKSRPDEFMAQGKPVEWRSGKTHYAARWFRVA